MRTRLLVLTCASLLAACATGGPESRTITVLTRSAGQALVGASCVVHFGPQSFTVATPAVLPVGEAQGDLRVTCSKSGFRNSELYFRAGSTGGSSLGIGGGGGGAHLGLGLGLSFPLGGGRSDYPPTITLEMTPL